MADAECTTATMDWTSSAMMDLATVNGSLAMTVPGQRKYQTDLVLMNLLITASIVGLLLNIAALTVLLQKKNRQIATNRYFVMLAIGDAMMCTIVIPLRVLHGYNVVLWTPVTCRVYGVLRYTPLFVSVNTVVLIAIERWVAIVLPAKFARFASPRNVKIQLALVWLLAFLQLVFPLVTVEPVKFGLKNFCTIYRLKSSFVFMVTCMVVIPLSFLVIAYGTIIVTVLRGRSGDNGQAAASSRRRNMRFIIICAVVTALFVVSWMPIFALMYVYRFYGVRTSPHLLRFVHVMFYVHPVFNPFVYFFVDARFRAKFAGFFHRKEVDDNNISMASVTENPLTVT